MSVNVKPDICTGCETCVSVCPFGAIEMRDGKALFAQKEIKVTLGGCGG